MSDVFRKFHKIKRKGVSIFESLILMIIMLVTIGAIFTTMAWAQRTQIFARQQRESRVVLFSWVQTFESLWPPDGMDRTRPQDYAQDLRGQVGGMLGTYNVSNGEARIGSFIVTAEPGAVTAGSLEMNIVIREGERRRPIVNLTRRYNLFTTDTVSDDVLIVAVLP